MCGNSETHLDLHIEHGVRPHSQPKRRLHIVRQPLLIPLLDRSPLLAEPCFLCEVEQTLELVEVLEPDSLVELERLRDQVAELRVALCLDGIDRF